jgi:4'-phosphopantetheinyl transferase
MLRCYDDSAVMAQMEMHPGEIHVWRVQGLQSLAASRAVLRRYTSGALEFAHGPHGKPYLRDAPQLQFNLSHSGGVSLVAVALDVEVGVDIERLRPVPDCLAVAGRFLAPRDAAALAETPAVEREREFFARWTRAEAMWKARGIGLYGAGVALDGDWTVVPVEAGEEYAAAVAAERSGMTVEMQRL